jgi:7,8-dihydropterin-6-yl-methyl-4-(beta-D-ribofuranosyl)aminobenzene 5'-phosphate synthase
MRLTVLSDNRAGAPPLPVEHGFSAFLECDGTRILFDTGGGTLFADNARTLGVHWWEADAVVLSHGHYDHTGGIVHALGGNSRAKWYLHPDALLPRYLRRDPASPKPIGMPSQDREALEGINDRIVNCTRPVRISDRVGVTGPIPRLNAMEGTGGDFYLDEACQVPDPLRDDQAVWIRVEGGVVVLMGCTHAGVGNTLDYIAPLCGERILAAVGGFHLQGAGAARLTSAVDAFRRHGVRYIRPAHCTGQASVTVLERNFPDAVVPSHAGAIYEW